MEKVVGFFLKLIIVVCVCILLTSKLHINADVHIDPQWKDDAPCHLTWRMIDSRNKTTFVGNSAAISSLQIETAMDFGILLQMPGPIPHGTFTYIEKN